MRLAKIVTQADVKETECTPVFFFLFRLGKIDEMVKWLKERFLRDSMDEEPVM